MTPVRCIWRQSLLIHARWAEVLQISPGNRFEQVHVEDDYEHLLPEDELLADLQRLDTQFLPDQTRKILSENNSPDIPFRFQH